jgi:phosphopantetheinyl transferase
MIKICLLKFTLPLNENDKILLLSALDDIELKILPNRDSKKFEPALIGKVLLKTIIAQEFFLPLNKILVIKNKLGKTVVKKPSQFLLDTNISYSGSNLLVGLSKNCKIGIDLEIIKKVDFNLFSSIFSVSEEIYINSGRNISDKLSNFYELWTRKEALLKLLITGLVKPLPFTYFSVHNQIPLNSITYLGKKYHILTFKRKNKIFTICTDKKINSEINYKRISYNSLLKSINKLKGI